MPVGNRNPDAHWAVAPAQCTLSLDEVHVWRASLLVPASTLLQLESQLAPDEREHAYRMPLRAQRGRFIASRGIQRDILARCYLGTKPETVEFRYGEWGKPELGGAFARSGLRFNVANAGNVAVFAVAFQRAVGIDVEAIRSIANVAAVAERFFSPGERARLRKLLPTYGSVAFFECWTRKEAWIKAEGKGLSLPLDQFDVAFGPGKRPRLLRVRGSIDEARRWRMYPLDPGAGYVAALCTTAGDCRIRCFQWSGVRARDAAPADPASEPTAGSASRGR